ETLSRREGMTLELVRGFVQAQLDAEGTATREDEEESARLEQDVARCRAKIQELRSKPFVFQASRDSASGAPLELPSVHFFCGHAFNARTLGTAEDAVCPLCADEHRAARGLQDAHEASAADPDSFFKQLRTSHDGFSLITQYLGRGVMNRTSVSLDN
ncbi:hypothetical protein H632_c1541p1, partial [Helicosporidium sp. ATCC 50920]